VLKYLELQLDTEIQKSKINFVRLSNNYVSVDGNAAKSFNILAANLNALRNYFQII